MINIEDLLGSKQQSRISNECENQLTKSTTRTTDQNNSASDDESDNVNAADYCGGTSIIKL